MTAESQNEVSNSLSNLFSTLNLEVQGKFTDKLFLI